MYVNDSDGKRALNPDELPQAITYNGPGGAIDTVTAGPDRVGFSYRQTFTYTNGNLTNISAWVRQ